MSRKDICNEIYRLERRLQQLRKILENGEAEAPKPEGAMARVKREIREHSYPKETHLDKMRRASRTLPPGTLAAVVLVLEDFVGGGSYVCREELWKAAEHVRKVVDGEA